MSPKRRYQTSSVDIGLGTTTPSSVSAHPPHAQSAHPDLYYGSAPHTAINRPITPAEIAVTPCVTYRKLGARQTNPRDTESSLSPSRPNSHNQNQNQTQQNSRAPSANKGNRTYRVRHHHQNHYDLPVDASSNPNTQAASTAHPSHLGQQSHSHTSLSQGIFGLPVIHDYLRNFQPSELDFEELGGHKITESPVDPTHPTMKYTDTKPRMKSTLPSHRPPTPTTTTKDMENMEGILQVRPASRSRTRPEQPSTCNTSTNPNTGGKKGARRRVQSSGAHHFYSAHNVSSTHNSPHVSRSTTVPPQESNANERPDSPPEFVDQMLQDSLNHLKSSDWEQICDAFHKIQHLTSEYPSQVNAVLKRIIWNGLTHVASSRTKVSRSACHCFKYLYETQGRSMEGEGDKVFQRLLDLSGGPHNKFIQNECKEALISAVRNTDPLKSILLIEQFGSKHRNANVREFAAFLLSDIMERSPAKKLLSKEYAPKVIPLVVGFLMEGQLNTRLNAKECLGKIFDHPEFDVKLRRYISPQNLRHVNDTLKKFRVRRPSS